MRVSIQISTGHVLEMQSLAAAPADGEMDALRKNAIGAGFASDDIDVRTVDQAGYEALLAAQPKSAAQQIAAIDLQMAQLELAKVLGRTTREDMLADWVWKYVQKVHQMDYPTFLKTVTSFTHPFAVEAFAAYADQSSDFYTTGVGRLKAFDDYFVALRAQRDALNAKL